MIKKMICIAVCAWMCASCEKSDGGGVFEPVEPPIEKPEEPTTPPSTEDLLTININDEIMAVVGTNDWCAIAYGNEKYVAVGTYGYVTTSTDGVNWTTLKQVGTINWSNVVYGNGNFFAITAVDKYIRLSTDGIVWTNAIEMPATANDIAYGKGKLVIACYDGKLYTSSDNGQTWKNTYSSGYDTWKLVIYANDKFVAVNSNGYAISSDDGETWQNKVAGAFNRNYVCTDIAFGNNKYIVIGNASTNKGIVSTSEDAKTWTAKYRDDLSLSRIAYCNGLFVMFGSVYEKVNGSYKYVYYMTTSQDGVTWTDKEPIKDALGNAITYAYGIVAVSAK